MTVLKVFQTADVVRRGTAADTDFGDRLPEHGKIMQEGYDLCRREAILFLTEAREAMGNSGLDNNTDHLVSIIMPSYNTAAYISDSIRSILAQTYTDWELIIVDDCSTDDSVEVIRSFDDPRIILLQNAENYGAAVSRNYALREAKGRWIAFLDSDDIWVPEKLEKQLRFMTENHYAFTYTDYRTCYNGSWMPYINIGPEHVDKRMMNRYCYFSTITVMYDREVIGLIQIKDIKKRNDYAIWLKAIEKSNAYRLPECLSYYIKHDSSISSGSKLKLIRWHYRLFRFAQEESVVTALWHTAGNLVFGLLKKIHYTEKIEH